MSVTFTSKNLKFLKLSTKIKSIYLAFAGGIFILIGCILFFGTKPDSPSTKNAHFENTHSTLNKIEKKLLKKRVYLDTAFLTATENAGLPTKISHQAVKIFDSAIDFSSRIRKGDEFFVVYEGIFDGDVLINTSKILAAEIVSSGKSFRAVRYTNKAGNEVYLTPNGDGLSSSFLSSPVKASKVSSGYSISRNHPILGIHRSHKGMDYAAPTGTPVKAVADGKIVFLGYKGDLGNLIVVAHQNNRETRYGHLSGFAKQFRPGSNITKGDVLGYVGMTGLATGPHLHFEFISDGQQMNPELMRAEVAKNVLSNNEKIDFKQQSAVFVEALDDIKRLSKL